MSRILSNIQKEIYDKYKDRFSYQKIPLSYCTDMVSGKLDERKILPHQEFVKQYFIDNPSQRGILIYHEIGSGKTLSAINTCVYLLEEMKYKKILFVGPQALYTNFLLEFGKFFPEKVGDIKSYNVEFETLNIPNKIDDMTVIVIDEAHILMNMIINRVPNALKLYEMLLAKTKIKILALSATPIIDNPFELSPLFNMLSGEEVFPRSGNEFFEIYIDQLYIDVYHEKRLRRFMNTYVSYYAGLSINPDIYPKINSFKKTMVQATELQRYQQYNHQKNPVKEQGEYSCATYKDIDDALKNIKQYSPKIIQLYKDISKIKKGNVIIYSKYDHTIQLMIKYFEKMGLKRYTDDETSCDFEYVDPLNYDTVGKIFSDPGNTESQKIKILIFGAQLRYGVSFFNVRHVFLMETYMMFNEIEQIIGRTRRICSQMNLQKKNKGINIMIYMAEKSIDTEMHDNSLKYIAINKKFLLRLQEIAVDRLLYNFIKTRNIFQEFKYNIDYL